MWHIHSNYEQQAIAKHIATLDDVFHLQGNIISRSSISDVIYFSCDNHHYFIKRYYASGKSLRRYVGRSRVRGEWENLFYFKKLNIPTANIVAYGEEYRWGIFQRGAIITESIPNTIDLKKLVETSHGYRKNFHWIKHVIEQVADYTYQLHRQNFIHYDLKWRNILVTKEGIPKIYFIDCPIGRKRCGYFLKHGLKKDLEALDHSAKKYLPKTMRLRFYRQYMKNTYEKISLSRRGSRVANRCHSREGGNPK